MPIVKWLCPVCKTDAPLNHYNQTACGGFIPPDYPAAVLAEQKRERTGVHVTDGFSCPRSRAIEADVDVVVNPLAYNALLAGQAWDKFMEAAAPADHTKVKVSGTIADIEIEGEIDRMIDLVGVGLTVADWKHSNNFRQKWLKQEGKPSAEYVIQTSIYAELYEQTFGERPAAGAIWYHFSGATEPLTPFTYTLLDIDACLSHKPHGGQFTVLELYRQVEQYQQWKGGSGALRLEWYELPLVGKTMSFGSKEFCEYCQVRDACFKQAFGAEF